MEHYKGLYAELDPSAAALRAGIRFDPAKSEFGLKLMGREVAIPFPGFEPYFAETGEKLTAAQSILVVRLVLEAESSPASGKFLSYAEVPWGEVYLANFKGRCILRLAYGFGSDLERFRRAVEPLGGVPSGMGDASYDVEFVEGVTVRLILWQGDEEFPPASQILFSDNVSHYFTAEDLAVVGDVLLDDMKKNAAR